MTNELEQLKLLVEARAKVTRPLPVHYELLGAATVDTDLQAILAAMQTAQATITAQAAEIERLTAVVDGFTSIMEHEIGTADAGSATQLRAKMRLLEGIHHALAQASTKGTP